jgi:hypothetical protein
MTKLVSPVEEAVTGSSRRPSEDRIAPKDASLRRDVADPSIPRSEIHEERVKPVEAWRSAETSA